LTLLELRVMLAREMQVEFSDEDGSKEGA